MFPFLPVMASAFQSFDFDHDAYTSLKNCNRLSVPVQQHLLKVYATLAAALVLAGAGAFLHLLWGFGGLLTSLGFLASTFWLLATPSYPSTEGKRSKLFVLAAFLQGASLGPLVELVVDLDPRILVTAFVGTACVFACFSGGAIVARRREYLFLGGILGSVISIFFWLQLASSLFGGSTIYYMIEMYGGLLLFTGYVLYDTQMIIEKADLGDHDYIKHAFDLFVDFVAIFVRLLVILAKNSAEASEKQRKERRRRV